MEKCVLEYKQLELISSVTVDESPQLLLMKSVKIPQRSLVILNTCCSATKEHMGQMSRVRTNHIIQNDYPNLILLSTIHRIDELVQTGVPLVAINMGIQDIWLSNNTVMAHLDPEEIDISEVTTQTTYDSGYDSDSEQEDTLQKEPPLSSFITSPADIETHQKVKLKKQKKLIKSINRNLKNFVKGIKISFQLTLPT